MGLCHFKLNCIRRHSGSVCAVVYTAAPFGAGEKLPGGMNGVLGMGRLGWAALLFFQSRLRKSPPASSRSTVGPAALNVNAESH